MAWEFVLENVDGVNWWKVQPETSSSEDCEAGSLFKIDGVNAAPITIVTNNFTSSGGLLPISDIEERREPVINEMHHEGGLIDLSGSSATGHSAIHFDSNDSIIFTDYTNNTTSLTISFWVYPTDTSGNDRFLFSSRISGGHDCWSILRDGSTWKIIWDQNSTQVSMATVDLNQWQHIAVSWHVDGSDTGYARFYKNGVFEDEQHGVSGGLSGEWTIGSRSNDGVTTHGDRFACYMSSISFHEAVLSADEILEIAKADHDQSLSSNFGNYTSSSDLDLAILGGTGNYIIREDYPSTYANAESLDIQSRYLYNLEVTTNTTGGTPHVVSGDVAYINKFPDPIP